MMRITVCFKTVPDFGRLSMTDWVVDAHQRVDVSFVPRMFNCFDESALEMALSFAEQRKGAGADTELTALTVDDPSADLFLRQLLALGYDRAVRVPCPPSADLRFNPLAISEAIAAWIGDNPGQVVILGTQGGAGDNRQTGFLVAERLGWPCIRDVIAVAPADAPGFLKVTSRTNRATLEQTVALPLVLIVENAVASAYLRMPTIKQKVAAKKKRITVPSGAMPGADADAASLPSDKTLLDLRRPEAGRSCEFVEAKTAREHARQLYDRYLKERLSG